ncbi:MAG: hypothetical protein LQ342_003035 [Letrouitia transgressa]|nr:MAG: hypothetical protein LQ342_003035 [Letrouitia transgressa]
MSSAYSQPHQLPQPSVTPPHTLPPLVPQNYGNPFATDPGGHRSQPLPPSHLPPTSNPSSNGNSYPVYAPTATTHYHGQNPVFPYRPPASESQGYPPYNSSGPSQGFPTLLPMPNSNTQQHQSYPPPTASTPTTSSFEQHPTHVVGSQGRRGILPSAAGRPSAIPNGAPGGSKASTTPTKDNDGKFPCEHCAKTYLHAKHLKRHLLRHTGVRPYSCGLCHDTFSRSDILKRHFQKCSVRRGNPTGANHLSHSRANRKNRKDATDRLATPLANGALANPSIPPLQTSQASSKTADSTPTLQSPYELSLNNLALGSTAYQEELQNFSNRGSGTNSDLKRSSNGINIPSSRTASGPPSSIGGHDSTFSFSTGQVTPDSLTTSGAATPYSFHHDGRLPFSPEGAYNATNSGSTLDIGTMSRPHSGPAFINQSHPHIMGSNNGSRPDLHEMSNLFPGQSHDEYHQHYASHAEDSHPNIKTEASFTNVPYTVPDGYSPFAQSKH